MDEKTTEPNELTHQEEQREGSSEHRADRAPTAEEEQLADEAAAGPEHAGNAGRVREHFRDMAERGAAAKGEGRIT